MTVAATHGLPPGEARRIRTRALAKWLVSAGAAGAGLPGDAVTELRKEESGLYVVLVAARGEDLARYRVVRRGDGWRLFPAPLCPLPPVPPVPGTGDSPSPLRRSAALRLRSETLAQHSAALRSRSEALLRRTIPQPAAPAVAGVHRKAVSLPLPRAG